MYPNSKSTPGNTAYSLPVIKDKSAQGEKVDIMFKAEDVSKLNRIYEQMGYNVPKAQGQTDRKKRPPAIRKGQNCGCQRKAL